MAKPVFCIVDTGSCSSRSCKKFSELQTTLLAAKRRRLWHSVCHQLTQGGGQDISYQHFTSYCLREKAKRENECFCLIMTILISRHSTIDRYHYPIHPRGLSSVKFCVNDLIILTTNDETPNIATAAPTS